MMSLTFSLEPAVKPHPTRFDEYLVVKDTLRSLGNVRTKALHLFLEKEGYNPLAGVPAPIEEGLLKKFNELPSTVEIYDEWNELMSNMQGVTIPPMSEIKVPEIGKDQDATEWLASRYREFQKKITETPGELTQDIIQYWSRPLDDVYKELKGNTVLELAEPPEAIPLLMTEQSEFATVDNLIAVRLDEAIKVIPEIGKMLQPKNRDHLSEDDMNKIRTLILDKYPDLVSARAVSRYFDFWSGRGYHFTIQIRGVA